MKRILIAIAFVAGISLASCGGNTSSDNYSVDSAAQNETMSTDSVAPADSVYPKTDTGSYRQDTMKKP